MYINISEKMKYVLPIIRITCNNFPLKNNIEYVKHRVGISVWRYFYLPPSDSF